MKVARTAPTAPPAGTDMDHMFDRVFRNPFFPEFFSSRTLDTMWEPTLDFSETDKAYIVRLEVPGAHRENLDVSLEGDLLTLSGNRQSHTEEKGENFLWQERLEGRFVRTLRLPGNVTEGKVDASYADGLLTVTLPKAEGTGRNRVAIK